jgi:hypothetical protein
VAGLLFIVVLCAVLLSAAMALFWAFLLAFVICVSLYLLT